MVGVVGWVAAGFGLFVALWLVYSIKSTTKKFNKELEGSRLRLSKKQKKIRKHFGFYKK